MKVLDSDLLIEFFEDNSVAVQKIKSFIDAGEKIAVTTINIQEVIFGFFEKRKEKYVLAREFFSKIKVLPYSLNDVHDVLFIKSELKKKGNPIGLMDEIIAGICIANNAVLVTRNEKHFSKIKELKTEK